jgi:hypothetical protein
MHGHFWASCFVHPRFKERSRRNFDRLRSVDHKTGVASWIKAGRRRTHPPEPLAWKFGAKAIKVTRMAELNASQLRHKIDRGETRDKVASADPAAAPLGTDEEAAGTPLSAEAVAMAHREEVEPERKGASNSTWLSGRVIYLIVAAAFGAATIAAMILAAS